MKKIFFVFLFLFLSDFSFAQTSADSANDEGTGVLAFSAGEYYANFSKLNSQLKSWGAAKTFSAFNAVGITGEGVVAIGLRGSFDGEFSLEWFLPQDISIKDSLKFRLHGWHLMTSLYGIDLIHKKHVSLVAGPGVDWGAAKLIRTLNGSKGHYNNIFIAPFARVELKFTFPKIAFGVRAFYRVDFTLNDWVAEEDYLTALPHTNLSGGGFQFFVGYRF